MRTQKSLQWLFIVSFAAASCASADSGPGGGSGSAGAVAGGAGTGGAGTAGSASGGTGGSGSGGSSVGAAGNTGGSGGAAGSAGAGTGGAGAGGTATVGTGGSDAGVGSGGAAGRTGASDGGSGSIATRPDAGPTLATDPGTTGDGDFMISSPFRAVPEFGAVAGVAKGRRATFSFSNAASKYFPGGSRNVTVYIPVGYVDNTPAPLLVVHDGSQFGPEVMNTMDNLIAANKMPKVVGVMIDPGANRSVEYDTVSDAMFKFVTEEVLPRVQTDYKVMFTSDAQGRASFGGSSGAPAAMGMAWFGDFRRVLSYSGSFVSLKSNATYPHGAWGYGETLIPMSPVVEGLRIFLEVGSNDNGSTAAASGFRNWVLGNQLLRDSLKAKGYHYKYIFATGAGHEDIGVRGQTLPEAMQWLWQGYPK
jgi:enterochelin esterase family protein